MLHCQPPLFFHADFRLYACTRKKIITQRYLLLIFLSFSSEKRIHHLEKQQHNASNGYPVLRVLETVSKKPYRHESVNKEHYSSYHGVKDRSKLPQLRPYSFLLRQFFLHLWFFFFSTYIPYSHSFVLWFPGDSSLAESLTFSHWTVTVDTTFAIYKGQSEHTAVLWIVQYSSTGSCFLLASW